MPPLDERTFEGRSIWQVPENEIAAGSTAVDVPPATESFRIVNETSIERVFVWTEYYTHDLCVPCTLPGIDFGGSIASDRIAGIRRGKCSALYFRSLSSLFLLSFSLSAAATKTPFIRDRGPTLPFIFFSIGRMPTQIQGTQRLISMQIHGSLIL